MENYKNYSSLARFILGPALFLFVIIGCKEGVTPTPDPPDTPDFSKYLSCAPTVSTSTFEMLTWNIEHFPQVTSTTEEVAAILLASDVDLVAFQEVSSAAAMNELLDLMPGWEGKINITGDINVGYLYKTSEVSLTTLTTIYETLWSPFPRPPVVTVATHTSGLTATLINIHLKCCGGDDNIARRTEASTLLQDYIETNNPNDPVIILGDFNDEITSVTEPTPFQNFIDAPADYEFVDMAIAEDGTLGWSYPSWPSHIDHILITNELFSNVQETATLKFEDCEDSYPTLISDHRPVMLVLKK